MMIGHLETVIQTKFIQIDDNGNVLEAIPVAIKLTALNSEQFEQALQHMLQAKFKIEEAEKTPANVSGVILESIADASGQPE
jgi:hypothetical protein|tara:strand:- start:3147 stop:3392 length:246 start_codon:yes stop_codon:yes gene_type:complete